jgi:hypothetical protein
MNKPKLTVTFKDPDVLDDAIADYAEEHACCEFSREDMRDRIRNLCDCWFSFGEYLTVEIDIEEETIIVKENK